MLTLPVLLDLLVSGPPAAFRYSVPDAFYYHVVARNFARTGGLTFDGVLPTNGFHPLWQLLLGCLYVVNDFAGASELTYLYLSLLLGLVLQICAVLWLAGAIRAAGREPSYWFAALPVGLYGVLLSPYWIIAVEFLGLSHWSQGPFPLLGTLWSYVNGMESSLLLAGFGLLAFLFVRYPQGGVANSLVIGGAGAIVTLSRLDHGLLVLLLLVAYLLREGRGRGKEAIAGLTVGFAVPVALYVLANKAYAGSFLPVSGSLKSTFPVPTASHGDNLVRWPPRVLELDDDIVGFATGFPVLSGTGYALDREAAEAWRQGTLPSPAVARGYSWLASLVYLLPDQLERDRPVHIGRRRALEAIARAGSRFPGLEYELDDLSQTGNFWILKIAKGGGTAATGAEGTRPVPVDHGPR